MVDKQRLATLSDGVESILDDCRVLRESMPDLVVGEKLDDGKPIMAAIPPFAEIEVAKVLAFGAKKYSRGNWSLLPNLQTRYMDAALRHLNAVRRGEVADDESGLHHLAHAACCVMFMLDDAIRNGK